MYNPFSLEGKTVLVTGASSGIGRAIAVECSRMGARVILTGRDLQRLGQTLSQMKGTEHLVLSADLTQPDDRAALCTQTPELDGVVHCAGINRRMPCKIITKQETELLMSINFEVPVLLQAALLSTRKIKKCASIVFIASKAAEFPAVGNAIYSASKGAIISYANVLALELAPRMVRVNNVCPAMVWTDMATSDGTISLEELEQAQAKYPLKRYGKPEEIAYLTIYLLSDASQWMTGSCIDITGGTKIL